MKKTKSSKIKKIKDIDVYLSVKRYELNTKIGKYSLGYIFNLNKEINIDKTLFLDVEPTSYEVGKGLPLIIGIGHYYKSHYFYIHQFFTESEESIEDMLAVFNEKTAGFENIVTFNGERYDINLLKRAYKIFSIKDEISSKNHIDLLKLSLSLYKKRKNHTLKSLERDLLNYKRNLSIKRDEIPKIFSRRLSNNNLEIIFKDNIENILSLPILISLIFIEKRKFRDKKENKIRKYLDKNNKKYIVHVEIRRRKEIYFDKHNSKGKVYVLRLERNPDNYIFFYLNMVNKYDFLKGEVIYEDESNLKIYSKNNIDKYKDKIENMLNRLFSKDKLIDKKGKELKIEKRILTKWLIN